MDFVLYLEKNHPNLHVTSILDRSLVSSLNKSEGEDVQCSTTNTHLSLSNLTAFNFTLSNDWSNFLKIHLEKYTDKAFLFDVTLTPGFKSHGEIKSIKHLHHCYEPYHISQFRIIGQYQNETNFDYDITKFDFSKDTSLRKIPSQGDCERLCWAIRQPYLYKNGGLWICGKKYRILYADYSQTLMAIEQTDVYKNSLSTFTASRLRRPNGEHFKSKDELQFIILIGFHRQDREQAECNATIMNVMDLLRKQLSSCSMQ
ncbi:unnamed protein product [Schistosoma turkestanicum]|nr:unnamed protein product [Schistosoma turkestanicum]